jgi:hypothetical protein
MNVYREQMLEKKGEQPMRRRRKWSKAVLVILLIAIKRLSFIPVSQPDVNEDLDTWRKALTDRHFDVLPPDSLQKVYRLITAGRSG